MSSYVFNLETTKIELHFEKSEYEVLTDEQKRLLIIKGEEKKRLPHPFLVGEQFTATRREYPDPHSFRSITTEIIYEIVKISETTIQLKPVGTDEKPITRKPAQRFGGKWVFSIDDTYGNTFYKEN